MEEEVAAIVVQAWWRGVADRAAQSTIRQQYLKVVGDIEGSEVAAEVKWNQGGLPCFPPSRIHEEAPTPSSSTLAHTEVPLSQTNLLTFEDQRCPGGHIKAVDDGTHIGHAAVEPSSLDVTEEHGPESPVPPPPSTLLPSRDEGDAEGSTAYPSDQFIKSQPFVERAASQGSSADLHADDGSPAPSLRSILSTSGPDEDAVGTSVVTDPRAAIRDEAGPLAAASATHPASPSVDCGSGSCSVTDVQPSDVQPSASPLATASINHVPDHRSDPPQAPRDHAVTDGREADSNEMGARLDLMDRGTLLAYRAELTLELAWMQQAIASREKYLILKRELLFET